MPGIRRAKITDLHEIQHCDLWCLPEAYLFHYYLLHYISCPELVHVVEENGQIVGYILAKMDQEEDPDAQSTHITSLAVVRTYRKQGLANKLMNYAHESMELTQEADFVKLRVRRSNKPAFNLYSNKQGYKTHLVKVGYYWDGEDAYQMRKYLKRRGFPKAPPIQGVTAA